MKILFLHGWHSIPGGVKPTYLKDAGHDVINPKLDDDDFDAAVKTAQAEYDQHQPDVVVGSSRGGAIAMNIESGDTPLVLLCPAWKRWGTVRVAKSKTVILHSRADEVIPFADSEELVRISDLPPEALIEEGSDHRLAKPDTLKTLVPEVQISIPTLCIGIDVAWWGGSKSQKASQRDTAVFASISRHGCTRLSFDVANLSQRPNRSASPSEPNCDSHGEMLAEMIERVCSTMSGQYRLSILSLDTPVEFATRDFLLPRLKAVEKGQSNNSIRRECEREIDRYKSATHSLEGRSEWNLGLRIQSGFPISPRVVHLTKRLTENGFVAWGADRRSHPFTLIECFPSESQWSLGINRRYGSFDSTMVRQYKRKEELITKDEAGRQAKTSLSGFTSLFESLHCPFLPVSSWIEELASHAIEVSVEPKSSLVRKGKGFDDPIDSGFAFFTSIAFLLFYFHYWGDGSDGTIVGPDKLPACGVSICHQRS